MRAEMRAWLERQLGMPGSLAKAWLAMAAFAAFSAIHFGLQLEWFRSGSPCWAMVSLCGLVVLFAVRHWRHQYFQLTRLEYRCQVAWGSVCLALTLFAGLNVVPQSRWALIDERVVQALVVGAPATASSVETPASGTLRLRPAVAALDARAESDEKLKAIQEDMNRWGTLFAWLLAAIALVTTFVTSWVMGIARDAKEQLEATHQILKDTVAHYGLVRRDLNAASTAAQLVHLHSTLDINKCHVERMVIRYLMGVLQLTTEMLGQIPDVQAALHTLGKTRAALEAIFGRIQADPRLRSALRDKVVPCLIEHHDAMNRVPALSSAQGLAAMDELAAIARLCRAL